MFGIIATAILAREKREAIHDTRYVNTPNEQL
jgi:hypothetical protein